MTSVLESQLQAVLQQANEKGVCPKAGGFAPEAQYCTTNDVFAVGNLIAKKYRDDSCYSVETAILQAAREFTFKMPVLLYSNRSEALGSWNVMERVQGITLVDAWPPDVEQRCLVEKMISALVEFEEHARKFLPVVPSRWRWSDVVAPLVYQLRLHDGWDVALPLTNIAALCDELSQCVDVVPCFDLFSRNIIWNAFGDEVDVTFVDFDKAARLVPAGEQLSHIALTPGMRVPMAEAVEFYAKASKRRVDTVQSIVDAACFFRALSGVRDSLPWEQVSSRLASYDPHASERRVVLDYAVAEADRLIPAACASVSQGSQLEGELHHVLARLANIARGPGSWQ